MDEFIYLILGYGYWVLILLAGLALIVYRTGSFYRRIQQNRQGKRL